jgi:hypothetical protein
VIKHRSKLNVAALAMVKWSTDWSGQWASENHYYGSDIPGTPSNKLVFDKLRKLDSGGSPSYITSFSSPYSSDPRHDVALDDSPSGGKRFRVWTK